MHQIKDLKKEFSKIKNNTTDSRQLIKCSSEHDLGNLQMNIMLCFKWGYCAHLCILVITKNVPYFHNISEIVLRLRYSCHLCILVLAKNISYIHSISENVLRLRYSCHPCILVLAKNISHF